MDALRVGVVFVLRWTLLYGVLSFVTQLWAGSQFSTGQGGGFGELIKWSAIFGAIAVAVVVERAVNGSRVIDGKASFYVAVVGQLIGTGIALMWFTAKGGPTAGDWWVGPACAALAVTLWVHAMAPRATGR